MLLSKDDLMRAMRGSDVRTALHDFAQNPYAPLPVSLQQLVDELVRDSNRTRIIISGRRGGRSAVMAEIAKQMKWGSTTFKITDPATIKALENATKEDGGATVPCPWGREDGRETFIPYDALRNPFSGATVNRWKARYFPMNDPSKQAADAVARQTRRQAEIDADALRHAIQDMVKEKESQKPSVDLKPRHEVDRLRTADILQAMIMRNATDKAIPEEWMDELSDLVWRERDRLGANIED